jgi:hypothetical protein
VVLFALVDHGHEPNGVRVDDGQRHYRFLGEHQHVEGIVTLGQRLRDEAVVRRVLDGRIEHAILADQAALFIELILDAGAEGNFDHALELLR